jgi:hypothetical protein
VELEGGVRGGGGRDEIQEQQRCVEQGDFVVEWTQEKTTLQGGKRTRRHVVSRSASAKRSKSIHQKKREKSITNETLDSWVRTAANEMMLCTSRSVEFM